MLRTKPEDVMTTWKAYFDKLLNDGLRRLLSGQQYRRVEPDVDDQTRGEESSEKHDIR